jgi:chemotaxis protein methyltransferase CheR
MTSTLTPQAFQAVTDMFHDVAGIRLSEAKRALVEGRLQKLAQEQGMPDVNRYVQRFLDGHDRAELTRIVDKLTTNETYFFREPQHFEFLAKVVHERPSNGPFRVWSAASSSGEEAYSIAMVLEQERVPEWEVIGTDLSTAMVASASQGLYPESRTKDLPLALLRKHCLKGQGKHEGQVLVNRALRERTRFLCANLTTELPEIGQFDVIFLRNVLIYFDNPGKQQIVRNVATRLKKTGYLFTGHAESLSSLDVPLRPIRPAVHVLA